MSIACLDVASPHDLLTAAGRGDTEAFGAFYDLTVPLIYPWCHRVLGDPVRAGNAAERIYLEVWRAAPR